MSLLKDISTSPIGFGAASVSGEGGGYGFGDISESDAIDLLRVAKERGINLFDTAPVYGFGLSEQRVGKAFKKERDEVFIVTKCGVTWHENKRINLTNEPKVVSAMLEQSLKDLDSDFIDLYMIHWPDKRVDIRRPMEVLAKAKAQGKIKHIGLCNTNMEDLPKAQEIEQIEAVQSELNLFSHYAADNLFDYLEKHNISFMSWGTFDKGIITNRALKNRQYDKSDCRSWAPWWKNNNLSFKFEKMQQINEMLKDTESNYSTMQVALAFNSAFPVVESILCGVRSVEQLDSLLKAMENLPDENLIKKTLEIIAND